MKLFGTSNIKYFVGNHIRSLNDLDGKTVIDIPAGSGYMAEIIRDKGSNVEAYDLFPEFFQVRGIQCQRADLTKELPIPDNYADMILCQEGIEHLPNQLNVLKEFSRILKPKGQLIITTPNISHLRAKLSNFLLESEIYNRMPINEIDSLWLSKNSDGETYFGHIFLIGIQKLKILAKLSGFSIRKIHAVKASWSSILLSIFLPIIYIVNYYAYYVSMNRNNELDREWKRSIYKEALRLNLNTNILFGKHLFIEFEKIYDLDSVDLLFYKKHQSSAPV